MSEPITEKWLAEVGFKWHQLERQPGKQWLLWLGFALKPPKEERIMFATYEDLGIEVASGAMHDAWYCWLRSDSSHRYSRFLHLRHIRFQEELIALIEAITGYPWNPANNIGGSMLTLEMAEKRRERDKRFDQQLVKDLPWRRAIETDDTMGGALPEHLEAYVENDLAKAKKR
jgi:hypothetical protein